MLPQLTDAHARAAARLDPDVWAWLSVGDHDASPWRAHPLWPHVLRDVATVDTSTTLLGARVSTPVVVAPTGYHSLLHPDAELASAGGAVDSGALYIASTRATRTYAEFLSPAAPSWLQVYVMRDRGLTQAVIQRAVAAGARALIVTGDTPRLGLQAHAGLGLAALHGANLDTVPDPRATAQDPSATVDDVAALAADAGLPWLVKGVLRPDDARAVLAAGAAGVIVSNHGNRQLPGAVDTATALPRVVDAVGGGAPVLVDGAIRDGSDVLTALTLGAAAVCVGRPVLWGLAADGRPGVAAVLDALTDDLRLAMALAGAASLTDIDTG